MGKGEEDSKLRNRKATLDLDSEEFRRLGHLMVDEAADLLASLRTRPLTPGEPLATVRQALKAERSLPDQGTPPAPLLRETADLLFNHSMFNGHPRFWGYITSPAAPIGVLGDLLASTVNPNVGSWMLSPMATEIETQTVRWIAELIGYPTTCGGLLVSGGNMANFVGFLAARTAKAKWEVRKAGLSAAGAKPLRAYTSREAHTWLMKAADLFGLGTDSIRWIRTDAQQRIDPAALRREIESDMAQGDCPFLVVGTAGTVMTGAVDPLPELAQICREYGAWFHVDGAYGGFAAALPGAPEDLRGLSKADSIAIDPHKWLYAPLEAGCALVREPDALRKTFSYHPPYYHFSDVVTNYFDLGLQNSRGFRALKVWLALRQAGRSGYEQMIGEDIRLAQKLFQILANYPELEPVTQGLSITTFRYVPADLMARRDQEPIEAYLDQLNQEILTRVERGGEVFLSNALIHGQFVLRLCIVNFRTTLEDIEALPGIVSRVGKQADQALRPEALRQNRA